MSTEESKNIEDKAYYFGNALLHAFTKGIQDYGEDTEKRKAFIAPNQHMFSGLMLVAMFSYLEGTLGNRWIERHGGNQKRELECLRIIRNAFVHTNSNICDLDSTDENDVQKIKAFIKDLEDENIKDDKGHLYPKYMEISADCQISLKKEAMNIFRALLKAISH